MAAKVAFFDIGGTLGSVRIVQAGGFATDAEGHMEAGNSWANFSAAAQILKLDLFPGVVDALTELRAHQIRLGIVSRIGDFAPAVVDQMLEESGILGFFRSSDPSQQPDLIRYISGDKPKDRKEFAAALNAAGHTQTPQECVFVGEDRDERDEAQAAGMRVTSHPQFALDVLDGNHLSYLKLKIKDEHKDSRWHEVLRSNALKRLYETGAHGTTIYAVGPAEAASSLDSHEFLAEVHLLGEIDAPFKTDLYLLRDVPDAPPGFAGDSGKFAPGFEGEESRSWIIDKTEEGVYVALPTGQTIEDFHFEGVRHHGHTLKLTPAVEWLRPIGFGPNALTPEWLKPAAGFAAFDAATPQLTSAEAQILREEINSNAIRASIEKYSNVVTTSRHIHHAGNSLALQQLLQDFKAVLGVDSVKTHAFVHEGRTLQNLIAEIPGQISVDEQEEIVIICAHLDSTAASDPAYRPATDPAPGADDDASGVAGVFAAAKALKRLTETAGPPRRTIRFALFNAEEHGLVGSRAYASEQRAIAAPIVAVYQMDMIGYDRVSPPRFEVHVGYGPRQEVQDRSQALAQLIALVAPQVSAELPPPEIYPIAPSNVDPADRRSDHASFHMAGYAACAISEDFFPGPGAGGGNADGTPHYHQPTDKLVELNVGYAANVARVVAAAVWVTASKMLPQSGSFNSMEETKMAKDFDSRNFRFTHASAKPSGFGEAAMMREITPGLGSDVRADSPRLTISGLNQMTGTPAGFTAEQPSGSLVERALKHVDRALGSSGFEGGERAQFVPDPNVQETSPGVKIVHMQQHHRGIPVFDMYQKVEFAPYAGVRDLKTDVIVPPTELDTAPKLDVLKAVFAAIKEVRKVVEEDIKDAASTPAVDPWGSLPPDPGEAAETSADFAPAGAPPPPKLNFEDYVPQVVLSFPIPSRPTVIGWKKAYDENEGNERPKPPDWGPFAAFIPANLTVFYQAPSSRLAWELVISLADDAQILVDQYRVLVAADDADSTEILLRKKTIRSIQARGKVYLFRPKETPEPVDKPFPLDLTEYPVARDLARPVPDPQFVRPDWCSVDSTVGNNVVATKGATTVVFKGRQDGEAIDFSPTNEDDQKILNIFYFCNYMHNFFYLLGFDEASGNFQQENYLNTGSPGDPVSARAHPGPVWGTANMATDPDGIRPVMNMGLVQSTNRHTAFDADVVFHEFCHGVTNRLVGGRMNTSALEQPQSSGMGEGWGDYFALTIQNFNSTIETERRVTGDWVTGRAKGIRGFPYGPRRQADPGGNFPDGFGDISSGRYPQDEHHIGEVWCAALMHLNRRIGVQVGNYQRGHQIGWQIVTDGLKLSPANPSMLDARDAILRALDDLKSSGRMSNSEHEKARRGAWEAFAEFGMGASASCPNASLNDIVGAEDLPPDLA
jgi:extracellular elastinolytic metalloproteinase